MAKLKPNERSSANMIAKSVAHLCDGHGHLEDLKITAGPARSNLPLGYVS